MILKLVMARYIPIKMKKNNQTDIVVIAVTVHATYYQFFFGLRLGLGYIKRYVEAVEEHFKEHIQKVTYISFVIIVFLN